MITEEIFEDIKKQAPNLKPFGAKLKFVVDETSIVIDGTGDSNEIRMSDEEADCTITASSETIVKMRKGDLNPMMAVMMGKIKIKGDMTLAMKLQSLI
ncbi:MAG: SCP2 sterol-binding domain-containing protein [Saprospiraceae bacterium]|nr:SCP2 sterol-binding domain-containing protein [Saprospiraceae bacterium]